MYELAWKLSRDSLDVAWWGIVGATEQAILGKVESRISVLEMGNLQGHVSRLTHRTMDSNKQQATAVKVTYDKEYPFSSFVQ